MKFFKSTPYKSKAQAMIEFALTLPLLLLLLYGILETGRLLFIYSSVVTASRQAARYGSATGEGLTTTLPRFQDCAGMRNAANAASYINTLDDSEIDIQYDSGPGTTAYPHCDGSPAPATDSGLTSAMLSDNKHRIVVTVNEQFDPILPGIVPFLSRTISATSSRTILVSVAIVVTAPPSTWQASTPTNTPSPTPSPSSTPTSTRTFTPSPTLQATYTPSNTPTITRTPTITSTPTVTSTPIVGCNTITVGLLQKSGNTMTMSINNPLGVALEIADVTVQWNHDKGHQLGTDKSLVLQSASLGGVVFWSGTNIGPYTAPPIVPNPPAYIPSGPSTIVFTFHQSYDLWDNSEYVIINLSNPGCNDLNQNQH